MLETSVRLPRPVQVGWHAHARRIKHFYIGRSLSGSEAVYCFSLAHLDRGPRMIARYLWRYNSYRTSYISPPCNINILHMAKDELMSLPEMLSYKIFDLEHLRFINQSILHVK